MTSGIVSGLHRDPLGRKHAGGRGLGTVPDQTRRLAARLVSGDRPDHLVEALQPYVADRDHGIAGFHIDTLNEVDATVESLRSTADASGQFALGGTQETPWAGSCCGQQRLDRPCGWATSDYYRGPNAARNQAGESWRNLPAPVTR